MVAGVSSRPTFRYQKLPAPRRIRGRAIQNAGYPSGEPLENGFNEHDFAWAVAGEIRALRFPSSGIPISDMEAMDIGVWFVNEYGIRFSFVQMGHMVGLSRQRMEQIESRALTKLADSDPAKLMLLMQPDRQTHWSDSAGDTVDIDGVNEHVKKRFRKLYGRLQTTRKQKFWEIR